MFRSLITTLILTTASFSMAEDEGWIVGLGLVSSDVSPEQDRPFFPSFRQGNKQYMFIPNLSYQWQHWSLGADGLGWKTENKLGGSTSFKAGFPSSSFNIGGQKSWFRYGLSSSLNYSDGLIASHKITAGPIDYSISYGLSERSDELSQKVGLGFPLWIDQEAGLTIIGSAFVQQDNRAFTQASVNKAQDDAMNLNQADYWHQGLTAFAVYQANPNTTLLLSGTLQFNDDALVNEVERINASTFNIFTLVSYRFGN